MRFISQSAIDLLRKSIDFAHDIPFEMDVEHHEWYQTEFDTICEDVAYFKLRFATEVVYNPKEEQCIQVIFHTKPETYFCVKEKLIYVPIADEEISLWTISIWQNEKLKYEATSERRSNFFVHLLQWLHPRSKMRITRMY